MLQSSVPTDPKQDSSLFGTPEGGDLDRRHLLRFLGIGAAAMAAPTALAFADPCAPTSGLPSHLTSMDGCNPNALVPHAHQLTVIATQGKTERVMGAIDDLVKKNKKFFQKTQFVKQLASRVRSGRPPNSIADMFNTFEFAWIAPNLCEPVSGVCKDFGCNNKCKTERNSSGGACLPLDRDPESPCECVCNPGLFELSLVSLITLLMFTLSGPDKIPATMAEASRLIVQRAGLKAEDGADPELGEGV